MKTSGDTVYARRIKSGSLAALVLTGVAALIIPLCIFFGVMAFFGAKTVQFNGAYVTGVGGLLLSLIYGPFFTAIIGLIGWAAAYLGIRAIGHFRPFKIDYVGKVDEEPNQSLLPTPTAVTPPAAQVSRQP